MIKGTGIDIIEIERISKAIKNKKFVERIFTNDEIKYFNTINNNIYTIAGTFAAKEAVVKALGTGLREFRWIDIEIVRNELGKPEVILYEKAEKIASQRGISRLELSISHCREYAVAQAIGL